MREGREGERESAPAALRLLTVGPAHTERPISQVVLGMRPACTCSTTNAHTTLPPPTPPTLTHRYITQRAYGAPLRHYSEHTHTHFA